MSFLRELLGGRPRVEDRKPTELKAWGMIEEIARGKRTISFDIAKKLPKETVQEELRPWKFYGDIEAPFSVRIDRKLNGSGDAVEQRTTITYGIRYLRTVLRGPLDNPRIEEGMISSGKELPYKTESGEPSISLIEGSASFIVQHWKRANPVIRESK